MIFLRRPGIIIFIGALIFSYIFISSDRNTVNCGSIEVVGKIKNIVEKEKSIQYIVDEYLCVSFKKDQNLHIGDIVVFEGEEKNLDEFYIKDFNYGIYLKSKGYSKYIYVKKSRIIGKSRYYAYLGRVRNNFVKINRFLYKDNSNILNSIVIGDRSTVTEEEKQIFSETGTSHIMAISGLHISILSGIILIFFGKINTYKRWILFGVALFFYNQLVGGGKSIDRAIVMTIFTTFCFFIDRKCDIINLLFIIASIMIFENKYVIYNISFQLSFMAVLSICVFNKYLKKYMYFEVFTTTISASIFTTPIILYNFLNISTVSIVGNLVVLPFLGLIIVGDILSIILYYLDTQLAVLLSYINSEILEAVMYFLNKVGNFGANNIFVRGTNLYLIMLYYFIVILISLYLEYHFVKDNRYIVEYERRYDD